MWLTIDLYSDLNQISNNSCAKNLGLRSSPLITRGEVAQFQVKGYPATLAEVRREITTSSRKHVVPMAKDTDSDIDSACNYTVFAEASIPPIS